MFLGAKGPHPEAGGGVLSPLLRLRLARLRLGWGSIIATFALTFRIQVDTYVV